jgi:hypothetical protein
MNDRQPAIDALQLLRQCGTPAWIPLLCDPRL